MGNLNDEIIRRRTFAIISHPDAGKTTLTEKLLLFAGAIQVAGAVKSNKIKKTAVSDFMEIERQRGISVTTSVLSFEYKNKKINILDTPGHQDFAEDTYRTLSAVDSVILVIDAAKGVETQTEKLANVARMRNTPTIIFINKLDREGKQPFDLLDEIEKKLNLSLSPFTWPVSMGYDFKGVYDIYNDKFNIFDSYNTQTKNDINLCLTIDDNRLEKIIHPYYQKLKDDIDIVKTIYPQFNKQKYLDAKICPVFFGSALNNFGVKELLDCFIDIAPHPNLSETHQRQIHAFENKFTGFIFKIHANIDPNHRDRIAFLKICSGTFIRNKPYFHNRINKFLKFSSPTSFMGDKKNIIECAYPGDVIGLYDSGNFKIGDTLSEGENLQFKGIPRFSPEIFRYVENADPMKYKQLAKGLDQLMDEGVAQLFTSTYSNRKIIGTVGPLQFDVIQFRLLHEYGAKCRYEPLELYKACWITSNNKSALSDFKLRKAEFIATDKYGNDVFLAYSNYALQTAIEKYPDIKFSFFSES